MKIKTKIWFEDDNHNLIFGCGKTQILEFIDQNGSISKASKLVNMNYKKAWLHIKLLQNTIQDDIVIVKKGRSNGGTKLTPYAKKLVKKFRLLENDIKNYSQKRFNDIFINDNNINFIKEKNEI